MLFIHEIIQSPVIPCIFIALFTFLLLCPSPAVIKQVSLFLLCLAAFILFLQLFPSPVDSNQLTSVSPHQKAEGNFMVTISYVMAGTLILIVVVLAIVCFSTASLEQGQAVSDEISTKAEEQTSSTKEEDVIARNSSNQICSQDDIFQDNSEADSYNYTKDND